MPLHRLTLACEMQQCMRNATLRVPLPLAIEYSLPQASKQAARPKFSQVFRTRMDSTTNGRVDHVRVRVRVTAVVCTNKPFVREEKKTSASDSTDQYPHRRFFLR